MAQAKHGDTVSIHYTGRFDDATMFETSAGQAPLQFTLGEGEIIPGLEQAVIGMKPGESKTVRVPVAEAYGPHRKELTKAVSRDRLPADLKVEVGKSLHMRLSNGTTIPVKVIEVSESTVTIDGNHPLAGEDLTFHIELLKVA